MMAARAKQKIWRRTAFCCFFVSFDDGLGGRTGGAGSEFKADDDDSARSASRSRTRAGASRRVAPGVIYGSSRTPGSSAGSFLGTQKDTSFEHPKKDTYT